ncbi:MAG: hypothetical protein ACI4JI_08790 [Ruminiclostridium sp.]
MENNNMNGQQANWQQALNEFGDQPQQPQQPQQAQYTQATQAQYAQPQQTQYTQATQTQYTQPQQAQYAQPQQAQYTQPQQTQYTQATQAEFAQAQGQFVQPTAPAYSANDFSVAQPIKKKNKVLPIVLIIVAIAIVVGGVIFACFTFFGNKGGSYEGIERNYFANAKNGVSDVISKVNKTAEQTTISVSFPAELTGGQDYGSVILSTKSYVDTDADKLYTSIGVKTDKRDYLTANIWTEGSKVYAQIPELSDTCLIMDVEAFAESIQNMSSGSGNYDMSFNESVSDVLIDSIETAALTDISIGGVSSAVSQFGDIEKLKELFTSENIDSFVSIAATAYFNNFKAEEFSNGKMETAEKTIDCNVYKIKFSMKNLGNFIVEFFNELQKNDDLYSAIKDATGMSEDSFEMLVSTVEKQLESADEDELEESVGEMVVYTLDGNIVGRDITFGTDESNQTSINITTVDNGDIFEYSFAIKAGSSNVYMGISGKVNGDKYEGTGKISSNDTTAATLEFTADKNTGNGEYCLKIISDDSKTVELDVTIDGDENNKTVDITAKSDGKAVLNINVTTEKIDFEEITIPSGDNVIEISDMSKAQESLQKYAEEATAGLQKIYESAGAGDDLLSVVLQLVAQSGAMSY